MTNADIEARLDKLTQIVAKLHETVGLLARAVQQKQDSSRDSLARQAEHAVRHADTDLRRLRSGIDRVG